MNIFILSTGRCGSTTFERACSHISNYTASHESRVSKLGEERLNYKDNHIESDNRLAWFLGRLDKTYGDDAFYVHLKRDAEATASSYAKRLGSENIIPAYARGIYMSLPADIEAWSLEISRDYVNTVTENIEFFLRNKHSAMTIDLDEVRSGFAVFWERIDAEGDRDLALAEFDELYNANDCSSRPSERPDSIFTLSRKAVSKLGRAARKIPGVIKTA
ncbi:hypothetical protein [Allorhodopirellula solitaria]|uniref:Stf0 sulfotransferase n=1 Tax=Allorhodopirellula solitaria TaxID=2527987 RepID=A0A5C5WZT9_9BACT|nr:hypothetical protein [Allorhodopirellula solitaria]TWT56277.1 hypothetical protein CA85_44590 [Allorhodopirellula solitaria]